MIPDLTEIIELTNRKFEEICGISYLGIDVPHRRCLHWSLAACLALRAHGHRACINAGTANFRANHLPEPYPTHIGFFWQKESLEQIGARIESGMLPEMHCWAVLPELQMIVDPTVQFLKTIADESGIKWAFDEPKPNEWLVSPEPDQKYYRYEANYEATVLADILATGIIKESLKARRVREPHNVL
jgi:hypothetical protein